TLYRHSIDWIDGRPEPRKAAGEAVVLEESEPLRNECRHFMDAVSSGAKARTDGREGLSVLAVLEAGQRSLEGKKSIALTEVTGAAGAPVAAASSDAGYFAHPLAAIDDGATIGKGTR